MKRFDRSALTRPRKGAAARAAGALREPVEQAVTLTGVGARGDALAAGEDGPLYAPFGLPGEIVRARIEGDRAEILEVQSPSADRIAPICGHFGRCGGCQLQHWRAEAYLAWKRELLISALSKRGIEAEVAPIRQAWGEGRRRAAFHAKRTAEGVQFGFMARGERGIVPIAACPVLATGMEAAFPALKAIAAGLAPIGLDVSLPTLLTEAGLDIDMRGGGGPDKLDAGAFRKAAAILEKFDIARFSMEGQPVITRRAPVVRIGKAALTPPPGAFLQPTVAGEETLAALALAGLGGAERVLDLFAGIGTFALRAAAFAEVHAVEGEGEMLAALKAGSDGAAGALKRVTIEKRDLIRTPVAGLEMKRFDAVIFDPPRSGARLQAEQIGASKVARVAAVSCDAAAFARDVRALMDKGFRLQSVTPVDQFLYTPHVEIVGLLAR